MRFEISNISASSFRPTEPSMIEADCDKPVLAEIFSYVSSVADMRIKAMKHENHSLNFVRFLNIMSICGEFDGRAIFDDCKIYEVILMKLVDSLGIGSAIFLFLNSFIDPPSFFLIRQSPIL